MDYFRNWDKITYVYVFQMLFDFAISIPFIVQYSNRLQNYNSRPFYHRGMLDKNCHLTDEDIRIANNSTDVTTFYILWIIAQKFVLGVFKRLLFLWLEKNRKNNFLLKDNIKFFFSYTNFFMEFLVPACLLQISVDTYTESCIHGPGTGINYYTAIQGIISIANYTLLDYLKFDTISFLVIIILSFFVIWYNTGIEQFEALFVFFVFIYIFMVSIVAYLYYTYIVLPIKSCTKNNEDLKYIHWFFCLPIIGLLVIQAGICAGFYLAFKILFQRYNILLLVNFLTITFLTVVEVIIYTSSNVYSKVAPEATSEV